MRRQPFRIALVLWLAASLVRASAPAPRVAPTVADLLALRTAGEVQISPDGSRVAYTVVEADLEQNAFLTQIWLADTATGKALQLTRAKKSSSGIEWSPNGDWILFSSSRVDDKAQLYAIRPDGGEAVLLTKAEKGVLGYDWSPDGRSIAFTTTDPPSPQEKDRQEHYGDFEVVRREHAYTHLWTVDFAEALLTPQAGSRRTGGRDFTVGAFAWSPDGAKIAFCTRTSPDPDSDATADLQVLELQGNTVKKVVARPGVDDNPRWSPDGRSLLFTCIADRPDSFARISRLAVVPAEGGAVTSLTEGFDEDPRLVDWKADGIYFSARQKTAAHLYRMDPTTRSVQRLSGPGDLIAWGFSLSRDARTTAFLSASPTSLAEVFVSDLSWRPRRLTELTRQTDRLLLGSRELISWKSEDGEPIEGVLIKPADFDPAKKYALLCVLHGGPTGIDLPMLLSGDTRAYPSDIWVARGALILKVNYRGSAGYGERFRALNVRNLGVGDAWDVLSGVRFLVEKGWVDPARVGCMGWSQGGYISAFLTTSTRTFRAISVGAGISDWATYYYNTDLTPFCIQYLGDDPVDDPEIYRKTSPMTRVKEAATPTLIQHGENDRRVPIANAYELRQGLADRGVPVEMVVYKGFGHGINKPKSVRAVMEHNLAWFNHYLFGDPKPDLAALPLPAKPAPAGQGGK